MTRTLLQDYCVPTHPHLTKEQAELIANFHCPELTVLREEEGFAFPARGKLTLFQEETQDVVDEMLSKTFFIHYYYNSFHRPGKNRRNHNPSLLTITTTAPIYQIFKRNCPLVERSAIQQFIGLNYNILM